MLISLADSDADLGLVHVVVSLLGHDVDGEGGMSTAVIMVDWFARLGWAKLGYDTKRKSICLMCFWSG